MDPNTTNGFQTTNQALLLIPNMYPGKTEPMIKNTTHSSIGCNGMANNDDYHGLEMYKNHAKDPTTEEYMQLDSTTMECGHPGMWLIQWLNHSRR